MSKEPRRVAAGSGESERVSTLRNLAQAHQAFIYGASHAALALMRSIVEAVLGDFYCAAGKDLGELIHDMRGRFPRGVSEASLHRLRMLANAVLHLDVSRASELREMDEA